MTTVWPYALTAAERARPAAPLRWTARGFGTAALKVALVFAGANTAFTGLNRAFGGIATLGWQGPTDFFQVVAENQYLVQDSHTRFLGGVWTGIGFLLLIAPFDLKAFRPMLNLVFALIFLGGLARFTAMLPAVVFGPDIVVSLIAELVGMPLVYLWLRWAVRDSGA